jgi:ElaB/YqjD/DUF883 family membrane-anchored ribosome-binding protein
MMPIMGGPVGSGHKETMDRLESNGNSLPPIMDDRGSTSATSTTDYVKSRISKLLHTANNNHNHQNDHDKVRNEALKRIQIADNCLQSSPLNSPSSPSRDANNNNNFTTGLFRTKGGGLA